MGIWLMLSGLNGAMAVAFAAWGAHGLDGDAARWVERASQFQLLHAVALLALARHCGDRRRLFRPTGALMAAGTAMFSGPLYLKALGIPLPVPMITPFGGISLVASWLLLALAGWLACRHARV